ncbi:MAG: MFS transporter, partial [Ilumatobacteraceae bacterium]
MFRVRRFHYAWVVFATAFVTLLGAAGFRSTPGILIDPLRDEFGWSRATVGTAVSINLLLFGFIGPFAAALQARYGLRRVTVVALVAIALGALGTTRMTEPWQLFLLWGVVVGIGSGCMATVFASTVASRWFVARRGLVTGALTAATASGQLVFLPLLSRLAEGVGWRWVGVTIAIGALAVVPIVVIFLRDRPEDMGLL